MQKEIVFTIDVEDGINIAMRDVFGKDMKPTDRVVSNTGQILKLLDKHKVKGAFFVLGQIAEHYPSLIKSIHGSGHEVGIHGYDHIRFDRMNRDQAFEQLKRAKDLVEQIIGEEVHGHRAPAFSINSNTKWGLEVLLALGFKYDSSIMPCKAANYGWGNFPKDICRIKAKDNNEIIEVPMSTTTVMGKDVPFLGGSYFRLLPYLVTRKGIENVLKTRPAIFYMHPYEVDNKRYPDLYFEELKKASLNKNLKMRSMWIGRSSVTDKLEKMLNEYSFVTMKELVSGLAQKDQLPVYSLQN